MWRFLRGSRPITSYNRGCAMLRIQIQGKRAINMEGYLLKHSFGFSNKSDDGKKNSTTLSPLSLKTPIPINKVKKNTIENFLCLEITLTVLSIGP